MLFEPATISHTTRTGKTVPIKMQPRLLKYVVRSAATLGLGAALFPSLQAVSCAAQSTLAKPTLRPKEPEAGNYNELVASAVKRASSRAQYTGDIRSDMEALVLRVQDEICDALAAVDGKASFKEDLWERPGGGGGRSRAMQDGAVFEKCGVLVSIVKGAMPKAAAEQMLERKKDAFSGEGPFPFYACGISLVLHPHNPKAPTTHANFRMFQVNGKDPVTGEEAPMWWFGGGADLTPSYLYEEDARHFHGTLKDACDAHSPSAYPKFKKWCDDYFVIKHRGETRGVGGIFFDDLDGSSWPGTQTPFAKLTSPSSSSSTDGSSSSSSSSLSLPTNDPYQIFPFMVSAAESFLPAYLPLVVRRKDEPFSEEDKRWQQLRRGRYVEFNLVYDRGTKFGLVTPGSRIESILASLPLTARWEYCAPEPQPGTNQARLMEVLRKPAEWCP